MNCPKCQSPNYYKHEEELGITNDCQSCGHWEFEKYDFVNENEIADNVCCCKHCQQVRKKGR